MSQLCSSSDSLLSFTFFQLKALLTLYIYQYTDDKSCCLYPIHSLLVKPLGAVVCRRTPWHVDRRGWDNGTGHPKLQLSHRTFKNMGVPVFPLLWMVLDSAVTLSQPSSSRFWYCSLTWVNVSSMSTGDCLALLQTGYFLPQLRWLSAPACERKKRKIKKQRTTDPKLWKK